ncbi:MAG: hypothetical protein HYX39_13200 [Bacteroidetes bacterium]|nr:hypothetical protein [Bacteroidota bacterium]
MYSYTLCPSDFIKYSPILHQCRNMVSGADVVYLGESSDMTVANTDSTPKKISQLIAFYKPDLKLIALDTYAVHAGIYKEWIKQFNASNKPKSLIVTMNLRSFGAQWINSPLEINLQKSVRMNLTPLCALNRFLMALRLFEDKTPLQQEKAMKKSWLKNPLTGSTMLRYRNAKQWDDVMAKRLELQECNNKTDSAKILLACHYIKAFAFNINNKNPRLNDFDEIVRWGVENNVKIYFNLLPENIKQAEFLVGKELVYLMRQNRDFLLKRYHTKGAFVIDNLEILKGEYFMDKNWTTEHYIDKGRIKIAQNIVKHLN